MNSPTAPGLLDGIRVLELGGWRPVAHTGQLLADLGADVIKIEPPRGDPMRTWPQLWARLVQSKRVVAVDLGDPAVRDQVLALADDADVVLEGFRPGAADRLGIGAEVVRARNPDVVHCSVSGYGQVGPLAAAPGHDLNYQAWAGSLARPQGGAPVEPAVPIADLAAGTTAAFAICASLLRARATGEGEQLDIAMSDVMVTWTGIHDRIAYEGADAASDGAGDPGYGLFPTADGGWVALGVAAEDHFWDALCTALELRDLVGVALRERLQRRDELRDQLAAAIAERDRDELVAALLGADVPAAPVLRPSDVPGVEHHRARGVVTTDATGRPTTGFPGRLADHPPRSPTEALAPVTGLAWRPR